MKDRMEDIDKKLIDYLHDELDAGEKKAMDLLLEADTDLLADYHLLKETVCIPDEQIVFENKTLLLKPEPRNIYPLRNWMVWGVAASLLAAVSIFVLRNMDAMPDSPLGEHATMKSSSHIQPPRKATSSSGDLSEMPSKSPTPEANVPNASPANQAVAPSPSVVKRNHVPTVIDRSILPKPKLATHSNTLDSMVLQEEVIQSNSIVEAPSKQIGKEMEFTLPTVDIVQHRLLEKDAEPAMQNDIANQSQYQQAAREKNSIRLDAGKQPVLMKSINGALGFFRRIRKAGEDLRRREVVVTLSRKKPNVY